MAPNVQPLPRKNRPPERRYVKASVTPKTHTETWLVTKPGGQQQPQRIRAHHTAKHTDLRVARPRRK